MEFKQTNLVEKMEYNVYRIRTLKNRWVFIQMGWMARRITPRLQDSWKMEWKIKKRRRLLGEKIR